MSKKIDIDLSFLDNEYQSIELPSRGLLYSEDNPLHSGTVNIRNWLTSEEKLIDKFTPGNFYTIIHKLVNACVEGNINVDELTDSDLFYILYWTRGITYGTSYTVDTTCPHCGNQVKVSIDIADYPITYLKDNIKDSIEFILPKTKIKLKLHCPRVKDLIESTESKHSDEYKMGITVNSDIYRYALLTDEMTMPDDNKTILNRETIDNFLKYTLSKIWNRLPSGDILAIREELKTFEHGYLNNIDVKCPECGEFFSQPPLLSWSFFRPSV